MTRIFEAIDRADHGLVWQLVQSSKSALAGVDPVTGLTPLALAAELGRTESIRTLIEAGADLDRGGVSSPLESAVAEGHIEIARMLIEAGADVNLKVGEGFTPLMSAAFLGDLEIARLLLERGAQPLARNFDGETAVDLAQQAGYEELSQVIEGFSHEEYREEQERRAAEERRRREEELQKRREERRARVRAARAERASGPQGLRPTRPGDRPSGSFSPVAKPLFGAEPQRLSAPGSSRSSSSRSAGASAFDALFSAPDAGQPAPIDPHQLEGVDRFGAFLENAPVLARRMIDFGDLEGDESNDQGESLLMLAAAAGEAEIVRVLLGKSVEIDLQDASENGETALLKAVQTPSRGRLEVLDLLVDAGADLERRHGAKERTPLMFAALSDIYTPDTYARQFGQTTLHLVRLGARLDAEDADGQRPVDIITQAAQEAPANSPMRNRLLDMQAILERAGG